MKEKTYVEDIDRSIYDVKDEERDAYKVDEGLTEAIVEQISREKKDPPWMELFRLQALQIYNEMPVPDWGPSIEGLDMSHIVTYVRPNTKMTAKWSDVPQDIKDTFERLGIPRQSGNPLPVSARSTTLNWYTTMCARRLRHRELYTRIWRVP